MNDEECLKNISKNLEDAARNLKSALDYIERRESDYYHYCNGFSKLIHQVQNLYREYYNEYCAEVKKRVIQDE